MQIESDTRDTNGRAYRIGELAKLSGLPVSTLRLWHERGHLGGSRSQGGHRLFSDRDLRWVLQARDLTQGRYMTEELAATVSALVESAHMEVRLGQPVPARAPRHDPNYERMLDLAAQNARLFAEERNLAQKLQLIVDNFPDSIVTQDRELRYTSALNPAFHRSEEMLGRTAWETLSAEDAEVLTRLKQEVIDTGLPARTVVRLTYRGELRYYDMVIRPLRDSSGVTEGLIAYNRDITEQVLADQAKTREVASLRRYERLFHALLETMGQGALVADDHGQVLFANSHAKELLGCPIDESLIAGLLDEAAAHEADSIAEPSGQAPAPKDRAGRLEVPLKNGRRLGAQLIDLRDDSTDPERVLLVLLD